MGIWQIILIAVLGIILVSGIVICILGNRFVASSFMPKTKLWQSVPIQKKTEPKTGREREIRESKDLIRKKAQEWRDSSNEQNLWVNSKEGYKLHAYFYPSKKSSHKYAVCIHGYRGNTTNIAPYGHHYADMGFNVLLTENRSTGQSEGKFLSMGWNEKYDVLAWLNYIVEMDSEAQIILHGESMGAAIVLMTLGENVPENLKCAVSESAFDSAWNEFEHIGKDLKHKKTNIGLYIGKFFIRLRLGFNLKKVTCLKQLKNCRTPVILIHGEADTMVPHEMLRGIYNAIPSSKDWFIFPEAEHCQSIFAHPQTYWEKIHEFIYRYAPELLK
ncbi:MAG: alpha/beta hydrolase [Treponema sp.]|nr:alpha/beta hydrolase [Treponema sp.]